jgi:hypothetical protein
MPKYTIFRLNVRTAVLTCNDNKSKFHGMWHCSSVHVQKGFEEATLTYISVAKLTCFLAFYDVITGTSLWSLTRSLNGPFCAQCSLVRTNNVSVAPAISIFTLLLRNVPSTRQHGITARNNTVC